MGLETAAHQGTGAYVPALKSYQKFRSGMGVWLSKKYENDPKFGKESAEANRLRHMAALSDRFAEIEGVDKKVKAHDAAVDFAVVEATSRGLIGSDVADAWTRLVGDMALVAGSAQTGSAPKESVAQATRDAASMDAWLAREAPYMLATHGVALGAHLASGNYVLAMQSYRSLRG